MQVSALFGKEYLKSQLQYIPESPGVYRMIDSEKRILYIGKAKSLKKRVSQYILKLTKKNEEMVSHITSIEYGITNSESDALMLEGRLIKRFKPPFNILLKDDKSMPYIKLRTDTDYPQLMKFRGKNLEGGKFFGPFASARHIDITIAELQRIFKLRSCSDSYFASRSRPCMEYQIKKCSAPCTGKISKLEYKKVVRQVEAFFTGNNQELQQMLAKQMEDFALDMNYEAAAEVRDRLKALSYIQMKSGVDAKVFQDADIFAIYKNKNDDACIELFMFRQSQPCGNNAYFPENTEDCSEEKIMESFLIQFYQNKKPPKEILLNCDIEDPRLLAKTLKTMHKTICHITSPKLGEKVNILNNAKENAKDALERHLKKSAKNTAALKEVADLFNIDKEIKRIEIYDNSHIQGSSAVGAMVVATPDGFDKKEYRLFNIKDELNSNNIEHELPIDQSKKFGGDDFSMLAQVLKRRFARMKTDTARIPDLMLIDGGKGHLSTALKVMESAGVHVKIVCISKGVDRNSGREQFHALDMESFTLDKHSSLMKYLQILRDEAHNFAIKNHRNKRSKAIKYSSLDQIPNIGEKRKKALLGYFGSFKAISDATLKELTNVSGISEKVGKQIMEILKDN